VYVELGTGHAAATHAGAARHASSPARVVERPLREVVPAMALAVRTRVLFLGDDAEARLLREFGGLAGLPRW
jgi:hypothetical protein